MIDRIADQRDRRRAGARLAAVLLSVVTLVVAVATLVFARTVTATSPRDSDAAANTTESEPRPSTEPGWDVPAESALAARPMLQLPVEAAQPRELSTQVAGPDLRLPTPAEVVGHWIPTGFPATSEGALAQLKALNQAGVDGGDPVTYARAYSETALPGAPSVERTGLYTLLSHFRGRAGIPAGQPSADLSVTYRVTYGQVKGSTDEGRYAVVCTLGELTFDYRGQTMAFGVGDCQAMRWTGTQWRISPGTQAALAPSAWPGSLQSVQAGFRALAGVS